MKSNIWLLPLTPEIEAIITYNTVIDFKRYGNPLVFADWRYCHQVDCQTNTILKNGIAQWEYSFSIPVGNLPAYWLNEGQRLLVIMNNSTENAESYIFPSGEAGVLVMEENGFMKLSCNLFQPAQGLNLGYFRSESPTPQERLESEIALGLDLPLYRIRYVPLPTS